MTITYRIEEEDLLTAQLYLASKSDRIRKRRQRSRWRVPVAYAIFGIFLLAIGDRSWFPLVFVLAGILWFFIYPLWERARYLKHFRGFIKEYQSGVTGRMVTLEISDNYLLAKEGDAESKVPFTNLEEISEIASGIIIILTGGQAFLLPENRLENAGQIRDSLQALAVRANIPFKADLQWKWK